MSRSAVVTGAASGIGEAIAIRFLRDGWQVVAVDRVLPARLDGVTPVQADLGTEQGVDALVETTLASFGSVQAIVNCAAMQLCKTISETSVEEWDEVFRNNVRSVFLMTRAAVRLLSRGGAIVNLGSVHSVATSCAIGAYAASKGAVTAFSRAAALEMADREVRVNVVLPGAVDTPMLRAGLDRGHLEGSGVEQQLQRLASTTPLTRVAEPTEIAEAVLFLADRRRSSFITGSCLIVDGGATARLSTE